MSGYSFAGGVTTETDPTAVHLTGDETVAGVKTFSSEPVAPSYKATGTTGAANQGRFVGVTTTGAPASGTYAVGDFVLTQNGHMFVCTVAGTPGTWRNPRDVSDLLTSGEEMFPRDFLTNTAGASPSSQQLRVVYFVSRKTETTTQVRVYSGATAAAATPSLCRIGLYTAASDGTLSSLVASTANDTALFAATNTAYTRSWSVPYAKVAGQRYALAILVVSATTMPSFAGSSTMVEVNEMYTSPVMCGVVASQADLPASVAAGSVGSTGQRFYGAVLP